MNLTFGQLLALGWHLVNFSVINHGDDRRFTIAMQPDIVCQVRCAKCDVAFAIGTVASRTRSKLFLAQCGQH